MNIQNFHSFEPLNETRYEDMYGDNFTDFITSYKHKAKTGKIKASLYYVQFTNYRDNNLDKSMVATPDHRDPVGVYAYPLSYVLAHPADIWYGAGAKNLRVLKNVSKHSLTLPYINSEHDMRTKLEWIDIGIGINVKQILKDNPYILDEGTGNKWAKLFFYIVQHDVTKSGYPLRSGMEQSRILKREFDAIIDDSKTIKKAVVNNREPEQICFLKRDAFQIVDVVKLHGKENVDLVYPQPPVRKLAARIALAMGDKLVTDSHESSGRGKFWTVKGRRIEISIETGKEARDGLKMGQKHHRHVKTYDYRYPSVTLSTEYGTVAFDADYEDSYEDLAKYVRVELAKAQEHGVADPIFKPENKKSYELRMKDEESTRLKAKWAEEHVRKLVGVKKEFECLEKWAEMVGMPYQSSGDPENDLIAVRMGEDTANILKFTDVVDSGIISAAIDKAIHFGTRKADMENPSALEFIQKTAELLRRVYAKYPQLTSQLGETTRRFLFHDLRE